MASENMSQDFCLHNIFHSIGLLAGFAIETSQKSLIKRPDLPSSSYGTAPLALVVAGQA